VQSLVLTRPDDWHLHLRDGSGLGAVVGATAREFARAVVMPNLKPPIATVAQALAYRERILAALPVGAAFEPLMTLYLRDDTDVSEIALAQQSGKVHAIKYYPAGATTNAESGVTDLSRCDAVLEAMQAAGMPLLVHGEVTDPAVDIFDRERVFIDRVLSPLLKKFPQLRVVFEHVTTREAVQFVASQADNVAATITAHHLRLNRNALFAGGLQPHAYCLPVLKRETHRQALVEAAVSGNPKFFLGTDSAPHSRRDKEQACGCAGIYTAHAAMELYAEAFEAAAALDKLEGFASFFGADFYGLPRNRTRIALRRERWQVPSEIAFGASTLVPLAAGETLGWKLEIQ
jgi:dihydroorotase